MNIKVDVPLCLLCLQFELYLEWMVIVFPFNLCRLWTPIDGEFDDYIVNPKPSGYQVKLLPFQVCMG